MENKITFFGKTNGISIEQMVRYGKFDMKVKHFHNQYEIFYIIEGERQFFFDNKSYNAFSGDLTIIDTNLVHTTRSITQDDTGYNRVIMYIDYEKMCEFDKQYPELGLIKFFHDSYGIYHLDEEQRTLFLNLYRDMRHELSKKEFGYNTRVEINVLNWLCKLTSLRTNHEPAIPIETNSKNSAMTDVLAYLEENYTNDISLDTLSEHFFLSKYYLCRVFKEYTGFTIKEYINMYRIKKATQMLERTNLSISDIADELGFESITYFERIFKKIMTVSPLRYKKSHQSVTLDSKELNTLDDSIHISN